MSSRGMRSVRKFVDVIGGAQGSTRSSGGAIRRSAWKKGSGSWRRPRRRTAPPGLDPLARRCRRCPRRCPSPPPRAARRGRRARERRPVRPRGTRHAKLHEGRPRGRPHALLHQLASGEPPAQQGRSAHRPAPPAKETANPTGKNPDQSRGAERAWPAAPRSTARSPRGSPWPVVAEIRRTEMTTSAAVRVSMAFTSSAAFPGWLLQRRHSPRHELSFSAVPGPRLWERRLPVPDLSGRRHFQPSRREAITDSDPLKMARGNQVAFTTDKAPMGASTPRPDPDGDQHRPVSLNVDFNSAQLYDFSARTPRARPSGAGRMARRSIPRRRS